MNLTSIDGDLDGINALLSVCIKNSIHTRLHGDRLLHELLRRINGDVNLSDYVFDQMLRLGQTKSIDELLNQVVHPAVRGLVTLVYLIIKDANDPRFKVHTFSKRIAHDKSRLRLAWDMYYEDHIKGSIQSMMDIFSRKPIDFPYCRSIAFPDQQRFNLSLLQFLNNLGGGSADVLVHLDIDGDLVDKRPALCQGLLDATNEIKIWAETGLCDVVIKSNSDLFNQAMYSSGYEPSQIQSTPFWNSRSQSSLVQESIPSPVVLGSYVYSTPEPEVSQEFDNSLCQPIECLGFEEYPLPDDLLFTQADTSSMQIDEQVKSNDLERIEIDACAHQNDQQAELLDNLATVEFSPAQLECDEININLNINCDGSEFEEGASDIVSINPSDAPKSLRDMIASIPRMPIVTDEAPKRRIRIDQVINLVKSSGARIMQYFNVESKYQGIPYSPVVENDSSGHFGEAREVLANPARRSFATAFALNANAERDIQLRLSASIDGGIPSPLQQNLRLHQHDFHADVPPQSILNVTYDPYDGYLIDTIESEELFQQLNASRGVVVKYAGVVVRQSVLLSKEYVKDVAQILAEDISRHGVYSLNQHFKFECALPVSLDQKLSILFPITRVGDIAQLAAIYIAINMHANALVGLDGSEDLTNDDGFACVMSFESVMRVTWRVINQFSRLNFLNIWLGECDDDEHCKEDSRKNETVMAYNPDGDMLIRKKVTHFSLDELQRLTRHKPVVSSPELYSMYFINRNIGTTGIQSNRLALDKRIKGTAKIIKFLIAYAKMHGYDDKFIYHCVSELERRLSDKNVFNRDLVKPGKRSKFDRIMHVFRNGLARLRENRS